jgi:2-polyprenyl-3-methyl-5-hydroxy-6-metoxy-1,4-benzoquinol methylase
MWKCNYTDAYEYLENNKGKFNIILALNVTEHMNNPQEFCILAYGSISDTGVLVIVLPMVIP